MSRESDIAHRLDAIVDELDDLAFEQLQAAVAGGATRRPASDKTLAQARRSIEKAAHLLRGLAGGSEET